jgi:hypothetical protein
LVVGCCDYCEEGPDDSQEEDSQLDEWEEEHFEIFPVRVLGRPTVKYVCKRFISDTTDDLGLTECIHCGEIAPKEEKKQEEWEREHFTNIVIDGEYYNHCEKRKKE